ncbi:hypothetical protein D3Z58_05330 [Clostridiaceae bacterium]|nr:hypothetical protein [Clostridiaceae bacterium]
MGAKTRKKESVPDKQGLIVRRTAKDSVFCNLFSDKRYLLQLYQALHPEDTETTEDDLTDITIRNVLTDGIYNDVGFRNKDKVIILTEAQSTWSMNILIRMLLYLAETYHDYFRKTNADLYSSKKVSMPNAELYVIFTGKRMNQPKYISLSEEFFHGQQCSVEVKAKVLYGEGYKDIVSQYVEFSKIYTEQVKKHGYTRKAVLETIRICKDQDVLTEYLKTREREVVSIMMALFDEEYIQQAYRHRLIDETTKEVTEAVTKEMTDKAIEKEKKLAKKLYQKGFSLEDIAEVSEVSVEVVKQWFDS